MRRPVQLGLERLSRLDLALHDRAVGEREREPPRSLVPLRLHAHELGMVLAVDEPPVGVDEPEAAVTHDARVRELDLVGIDDVQRLHGRDADADDAAFHSRQPSYWDGSCTSTTSPPRRTPPPSSSTIQKFRPVTWTATL